MNPTKNKYERNSPKEKNRVAQGASPGLTLCAGSNPGLAPWAIAFGVFSVLVVLFILGVAARSARAELTFEPSWQPPRYQSVRAVAIQWIDQGTFEASTRQQMRSLWPLANQQTADGTQWLDRIAETFALGDLNVRALVENCNARHQGLTPPEADRLSDENLPKILRDNMRLYYARWLVQHRFYDESISMLDDLAPDEVVDPAGLLFYRAVAHHQLVHPEESRAAVAQLLEHEEALSQRYLEIARLLQSDLKTLEDESLDHIARRMDDVRRRLEMGRAGDKVQLVENGVVDSLDKIIKKLEEQQKQSAASAGSAQSSTPMKESRLPSMKAPMQVDQRDLGNQSGWGNLPPKEREEALQQISREFPAHYREVIEQYFRDLANPSEPTPSN